MSEDGPGAPGRPTAPPWHPPPPDIFRP